MKITILSLFPGMFDGILHESLIKRAINSGKVEIEVVNFSDYSKLNNKMVDDTPYGGGAGMVLRCEPIFEAMCEEKVKSAQLKIEKIELSPEGEPSLRPLDNVDVND